MKRIVGSCEKDSDVRNSGDCTEFLWKGKDSSRMTEETNEQIDESHGQIARVW